MTKDEKSRSLILQDFSSTLFVEAAAGSGKTTAMVSRIIQMVIRGLADIREIVAITFTNEGAASLKSKILYELESAARQGTWSPPGGTMAMLAAEETERVRTALEYLPLAPFSTIHAFCLNMLRERPVEAGIDPGFDMNTEGNVVWVFDEAWLSFLLESASAGHPFMKFALDNAVDLEAVHEIARRRCEHPDLTLYTQSTDAVTDDQVKKAFHRVSEIVATMADHIEQIESDRASRTRDERLAYVKATHNRVSTISTLVGERTFLMTHEVYGNWSKKLSSFEKWTEDLEKLCGSLRKQHEDHIHHHCARFIEEFVVWFSRHKKQNSSLYFDDLLWLTREMLRTHPEVREYFKRRYRYLCIDETQDTDPLQTEIVFFLAEEEGTCAEEWRKVRLAPSKLFMVGDPKQSIYKFRRAEIAMYEETRELIRRQGGKIVYLERNFRSAAPIIAFVNGHFSAAFESYKKERAQRLQPAYVALTPGATQSTKLEKHVFGVITPDTGRIGNTQDFIRLEGEKIISFLLHLTSSHGPKIADPRNGDLRPVQFSDVMILLKSTAFVDAYERMLEEADIPHYQVGGKTFFQTEDIRGCVFALKAVDDPTDTVSLFGALRSPLFGFSDSALFGFVSGGRRLNLFAAREEDGDQISRALVLLRKLHYRRDMLRPSGVMKEMFNVSGLCHVVMTEPNGVQKSSRYFRLLELVVELEQDHTRSFRAVVDALLQVMDTEDPQLANVTLVKSAENAVKISTIHKAKGLEAPVVILANGKTKPFTKPPDAFVLRDEGKIVCPYGKAGGFYSKDPETLEQFEMDRERCEDERLRYVAATRARDILVLCVPSAEEGYNTFNGSFAPSLMLNELVATVSTGSPRRVRSAHAQTVDLLQTFRNASARRAAKLKDLSEHLGQMKEIFVGVHDMMEIDQALFRTKRVSRGKAFGNVLHRMMQVHVENEHTEVSSLIDAWMEDEGVPGRHRKDLLEGFDRLQQNPRVIEARSAPEKFCEWEFYLRQGEHILVGVIDLVYRTPGGQWLIVDYKTDDVSEIGRKKKLDTLYGEQLKHYAQAFEQITGTRVTEAVLLYADQTEETRVL
jgi:ATP-dependent helicase/nuclease subunit A